MPTPSWRSELGAIPISAEPPGWPVPDARSVAARVRSPRGLSPPVRTGPRVGLGRRPSAQRVPLPDGPATRYSPGGGRPSAARRTPMEESRNAHNVGAWTSRDAVEAWLRSTAARNATLAPATERMLNLAGLRPGARVLDLGTGTGDQAFAAAARVGPEGHVLATDIAAEMVAEAAAGAARMRLGNVDTRVLDVAALDLEPDHWDAVISRLGLMFTPNLAAALTGAHRVLRHGGRIAVIVWSTLERNPFHATPLAVLRGLGRPAPPDAELVRAFSLAAPGALARALEAARFRDVVVDPVPAPRQFASMAEVIAYQRDLRPLARAMAHLDDKTRATAWTKIEHAYRRFETPSGVAFPGEVLVGGAAK